MADPCRPRHWRIFWLRRLAAQDLVGAGDRLVAQVVPSDDPALAVASLDQAPALPDVDAHLQDGVVSVLAAHIRQQHVRRIRHEVALTLDGRELEGVAQH